MWSLERSPYGLLLTRVSRECRVESDARTVAMGEKMARRGSKRRRGIYFVLRFLLVEANDELLRILRRNLFHVEDAA